MSYNIEEDIVKKVDLPQCLSAIWTYVVREHKTPHALNHGSTRR